MKKTARQRDLPALIDSYQQAYWQASSLDARNGIALKLWALRQEAQTHQRLLPHGSGAKEKARTRLAPEATRVTCFLCIARWPHYGSTATRK